MAYCGKCLHLDVCKTAETCDGHVPRCKHFMDKDEHPKLSMGSGNELEKQITNALFVGLGSLPVTP